MRKRTGLYCAIAFGAALALAPGSAWADRYAVEFSTERSDDDGALRKAKVTATLTPDRNRIRLTRAASDTGLYYGWAGFLTQIEAVDANGRAISLIAETPGVWRLAKRVRGEITVRYSVNLQHDRFYNEPGDDELAYARDYGVMWTGRALFLEGAASDNIIVEFALPDDWKVSTPWRRSEPDRWRFVVKDTDDLLDSAFMAGAHNEIAIDIGAAKALIALGPPVADMGAMFQQLIQVFFGAYAELFQDAPTDNFLLIGGDASFLGGGVMGRTISLSLPEEAVGPEAQFLAAYIIAHEGFHLWNVKWGGQNTSAGSLEWLAEGAAEYYAFLTSLRLGLIDEQTFWGFVSERYVTYTTVLASGDSLVSAAGTKNTAGTSYDLIYSGGMMALLVIDLEIRAATDGKKSLDDVVRAVHAKYATGVETLTLDSLMKLIQTETGVNFKSVIRRNIRGTEPLDLAKALEKIGRILNVEETNDGPVASITGAATPSRQQTALHQAFVSGE